MSFVWLILESDNQIEDVITWKTLTADKLHVKDKSNKCPHYNNGQNNNLFIDLFDRIHDMNTPL